MGSDQIIIFLIHPKSQERFVESLLHHVPGIPSHHTPGNGAACSNDQWYMAKNGLLLDTTQTCCHKILSLGGNSINSSTGYKIDFCNFCTNMRFFEECVNKRYDARSLFLWCTQATKRVVSFGISSRSKHTKHHQHTYNRHHLLWRFTDDTYIYTYCKYYIL